MRHAIRPMPSSGILRFENSTHVRVGRRALLFFGGSNYLGLTWHPALRRAMAAALRRPPLHPNGSRATTGENAAYLAAERAVADFFGAEAAVLVATGYLGPIAAGQALAARITHVFLDESAHPCVADGARLTGRRVIAFPCGNLAQLRRLVARLPREASPLVAADGTFGVRGGIAPLDHYLACLPRRGWLLVDDAHGGGAVGPGGRGAVALLGLRDPRIVQTVSFAKAFGVAGGAVLGAEEIIATARRRSGAVVGSTSLPLPLVAAVAAAVRLVGRSPGRVQRLQANARLLQRELPAQSEILVDPRTPVTGVYPATPGRAAALRAALVEAGIFPSWIRYLRGPAEGFFRFALSSEHTPAQVRLLAATIRDALRPVSAAERASPGSPA